MFMSKEYLKIINFLYRLSTLSRTLPQFRIKWKSHNSRGNTRYGTPTPAQNAISCSGFLAYSYLVYIVLLFIHTIFKNSVLIRWTVAILKKYITTIISN